MKNFPDFYRISSGFFQSPLIQLQLFDDGHYEYTPKPTYPDLISMEWEECYH